VPQWALETRASRLAVDWTTVAGTDLQTGVDAGSGSGEGDEPRQHQSWIRFAVTFGALAIASEILYHAVTLESAGFQVYLGVLARISAVMLGWIEPGVAIRGNLISSPAFSVEVARGCDAVQVCSLLAAAVVAFPLGVKARLRGLALGILVLQVFNLLRIVTLFLIGAHFSTIFHASHVYIWPTVLIVVTITVWIAWVRWETRLEPPVEHAS
jgi:exosortase H (IPTLxxWG-CTERM-specific)